jgi:hypothetical protein
LKKYLQNCSQRVSKETQLCAGSTKVHNSCLK